MTKKVLCGFGIDLDAVSSWINTANHAPANSTDVSRGIFGATIGLDRVLKMLQRHSIKATFFTPAHTAESFQQQVIKVRDDGHEIGLHGYTHEYVSDLSEEQERAVLAKSIDVIYRLVGKYPRGWTAPAWTTSTKTVRLLEEYGIMYDHSFMHHDCQPYYLPYQPEYIETDLTRNAEDWMHPMGQLQESKVIEIPANWHLDDWPPLNVGQGAGQGFVDPDVVLKIWKAQFDFYYREYDSSIFPISIHPQVTGKAHVQLMQEKMIDYINSHHGVEWVTLEGMAKQFKEQTVRGHQVHGGCPSIKPKLQNFIVGILIGLTGELYVALNLLGAGGGKPNSASTINTANAILCAVYAIVALFGGSILNKTGPAWTALFGVLGYILYIGSLWHFDQRAVAAFPLFAAVCIGTSAGFIYVVQGYVSMSYSEESERGSFVSMTLNLQALGSVIGGLIPLIINRNKSTAAGVPPAVYIVFIVMDFIGAAMAFLLASPEKVLRGDGTNVAEIKPRTFMEELMGNIEALKVWKLWLMVPAFLPSQVYLVFLGSTNVYANTLRARSLLSFCAVALQIIVAFGLTYILDNPKLHRRARAIAGLCVIGLPLIGAWIWETIQVKDYNRDDPPENPTDWADAAFARDFVLFMMVWVFSALWQYIIMYFLGCFTNNPRSAANNAGVFRGFMAAGEAIAFGIDSRKVAYVIQSSIILGFYVAAFCCMGYLALFVIKDTKYFMEEEVTVPNHVKQELAQHLEVQDLCSDMADIGIQDLKNKQDTTVQSASGKQ